jgi:hypothetical protein
VELVQADASVGGPLGDPSRAWRTITGGELRGLSGEDDPTVSERIGPIGHLEHRAHVLFDRYRKSAVASGRRASTAKEAIRSVVAVVEPNWVFFEDLTAARPIKK